MKIEVSKVESAGTLGPWQPETRDRALTILEVWIYAALVCYAPWRAQDEPSQVWALGL